MADLRLVEGGKAKRIRRAKKSAIKSDPGPGTGDREVEAALIKNIPIDTVPVVNSRGRGPRIDESNGMGKLTVNERAFVRAMLKGAPSQSEAFRQVYKSDVMSKHDISKAASVVALRPRVQRALTLGFDRLDQAHLHSRASRRSYIDQALIDVVATTDSDATRVAALALLGKSGSAQYFLERHADVEAIEDLTEEQVAKELEIMVKKALSA